jgi:hypothetical protein
MDEKSILKLLMGIQSIMDERIYDQTIPALNSIQQRMDEGDNKNQLDAEIALLKDHVDVLICVIGNFCDENQMRWPQTSGGHTDDSKTD